eukprot:4814336-Amphidinium_carterae.1
MSPSRVSSKLSEGPTPGSIFSRPLAGSHFTHACIPRGWQSAWAGVSPPPVGNPVWGVLISFALSLILPVLGKGR